MLYTSIHIYLCIFVIVQQYFVDCSGCCLSKFVVAVCAVSSCLFTWNIHYYQWMPLEIYVQTLYSNHYVFPIYRFKTCIMFRIYFYQLHDLFQHVLFSRWFLRLVILLSPMLLHWSTVRVSSNDDFCFSF